MTEFADYSWLIGDDAALLLTRAAGDRRPELQQLEALRKVTSPDRASLVVEQAQLRRRAAAKFGDLAGRMFFTPVLLEQATDLAIARYKAARIRQAAASSTVHDYCCGIGGDLLALAGQGVATGWDLSPIAVLLAEANLRAATAANSVARSTVCVGDATQLAPAAEEVWHVDPDRRVGGRRSVQLADHSPGPAVIERWLAAAPTGAVKLAPAAEVRPAWAEQACLEWISRDRECRQLVVWFGELADAPGKRRATVVLPSTNDSQLPGTSSFVGAANVCGESAEQPGRYVFDPDPSILAADLLGAAAIHHELHTLGAGGAYLTGDRAIVDPLLAGFEVTACLPLRTATIAQHLAAAGVGRLEIKKRGVPVDPEAMRRKLKLRGERAETLVLTRIGKRQVAIVARRLAGDTG